MSRSRAADGPGSAGEFRRQQQADLGVTENAGSSALRHKDTPGVELLQDHIAVELLRHQVSHTVSAYRHAVAWASSNVHSAGDAAASLTSVYRW